ncbi:ABC transporter permease [Ferruginibacter paludis]|uniref:ABC transporter permease n=1 Tax=Ferruginibacter paludis TaxID=1310417 RepID=UPI0025B3D56A|nr:ABC transporter permease [Ferruginibacter paludis]MDN3655943.1 ABC transporter permease [Ferruginibacter paludis]
MFRNYFKTAWRNLWKNRTFSLLNISGLAVGISCAALIFLWVEDEYTYNDYFTNRDHLYQVMDNQVYDGKTYTFASLPGPFAKAAKEEIPGIKNIVRTNWGNRALFNYQEKGVYANGMYTDSAFLKMFNYEFIQGNAANAFSQLYSLVVTESMAKKIFNSTDVIGRQLKMENQQDYTITAVVKDMPLNTRFARQEWLAPFEIFEKQNNWLTSWGNNGIQNFIELEPTANEAAVNSKMYGFIKAKDKDASAMPFLLAVKDWRLRSNFVDGKQSGGKIKIVKLFTIIAWIILIIACINFMNLSTAKSGPRAKEVGVRKVMGSAKSMLVWQFICEAILMAFIGVVIAVGIVALLLPAFNLLVEKQLSLGLLQPAHFISLVVIGLLCGFIAGSYPAFYLSSFQPLAVLKGLKLQGNGAGFIRKGLVITQFVISVALIICTIIIYEQVMHTKNRELGMNKDNLVMLNQQIISTSGKGDIGSHFENIKNDLVQTGVVEQAALSSSGAFSVGSNSSSFNWKGKEATKDVLISMNWVTPGYINTMGMQLLAGRDFHQDGFADSNTVIINETLAKMITPKQSAVVGTQIERDSTNFEVVGVIKDYVYNNVYGGVAPLIIFNDKKAANTSNLLIRFKPRQDYKTALAKVESVIKTYNPTYPFEYEFASDSFKELFINENLIGKLAGLFAVLAIFISCLGLFGLSAYTAERRVKEIGIRKVLGASVQSLGSLLSKEFVRLVGISCLLAFPLAWYFMHKWLLDYEYRITISWWMFVLPAVMAMLITIITVSFQAAKAALMNPVKSLRSE